MHVIILGSGVVGTTTAWYLARAGARVTVLERQDGPALETSYGNAGQISPGYAAPWAAPGIPLKALKWLFQRHAPLSIRPDGSLWQWQWLVRMLANCNGRAYAINKARMLALAEYSRDCLRTLRADIGLHYEERSLGTLQLFRSPAQLQAAARDVAVLERLGVAHELLDAAGVLRTEPGLAAAAPRLTGGLHLPNDETGDCRLFTARLAEQAAALGVKFRFGCHVAGLELADGRVCGVRVGEQLLRADRYVLACGSYSRALLQPLGLALPVYPVKGYSLTIPLADEAHAPRSTVLDETWKVAITRFAQRIRVGGMAELAGFDRSLRAARRATLEMVVNDLFPGCGPLEQAEFWCGLRPMTPDGTPIIGATPWPELYLNTGHGTLGWTMACGSGRLLADLLLGRQPDLPWQELAVARYGKVAPEHSPSLRNTSA